MHYNRRERGDIIPVWLFVLFLFCVVVYLIVAGVGKAGKAIVHDVTKSRSGTTSSVVSASTVPPTTALTGPSILLTGTGVSHFGDSDIYYANVSGLSIKGGQFSVNFEAFGPGGLNSPQTACVVIDAADGSQEAVINPLRVDLTVSTPNTHYAGTLVFALSGGGTYVFIYSCYSNYSDVPLFSTST